jgi:putative membrane protein
MILLASNVLEGFEVGGFWNAALFAIVLAIISMVFEQAKEAID